MLPHVVNRPISLVRCPAGRAKKCFFQRHAGSGVPPQLSEVPIEGFGEDQAFLYIKNVSGLMALVQMGVLEMHPWGSRVDNPMKPDRLIFDLDPGEGLAFSEVVKAAKELRAFLKELGLVSFLKTTGGKGLHIVVPIARRYSWPDVKSFAKRVGELMTRTIAGALSHPHLHCRAAWQNLHRLSAQRSNLDRGRPLLHPCP